MLVEVDAAPMELVSAALFVVARGSAMPGDGEVREYPRRGCRRKNGTTSDCLSRHQRTSEHPLRPAHRRYTP
ncbi:hypothetical protein, partial [Xanthomonas perforans]